MESIPDWLRSMRLHKYSWLLANTSYDEMMAIEEDHFMRLRVTKGAGRKLYVTIMKLKDRHTKLCTVEQELIAARDSGIHTALEEMKSVILSPIRPEGDSDIVEQFLKLLTTISAIINEAVLNPDQSQMYHGLYFWVLNKAMKKEAFSEHACTIKKMKFTAVRTYQGKVLYKNSCRPDIPGGDIINLSPDDWHSQTGWNQYLNRSSVSAPTPLCPQAAKLGQRKFALKVHVGAPSRVPRRNPRRCSKPVLPARRKITKTDPTAAQTNSKLVTPAGQAKSKQVPPVAQKNSKTGLPFAKRNSKPDSLGAQRKSKSSPPTAQRHNRPALSAAQWNMSPPPLPQWNAAPVPIQQWYPPVPELIPVPQFIPAPAPLAPQQWCPAAVAPMPAPIWCPAPLAPVPAPQWCPAPVASVPGPPWCPAHVAPVPGPQWCPAPVLPIPAPIWCPALVAPVPPPQWYCAPFVPMPTPQWCPGPAVLAPAESWYPAPVPPAPQWNAAPIPPLPKWNAAPMAPVPRWDPVNQMYHYDNAYIYDPCNVQPTYNADYQPEDPPFIWFGPEKVEYEINPPHLPPNSIYIPEITIEAHVFPRTVLGLPVIQAANPPLFNN